MKSLIIDQLESKGFEILTDKTFYNHETKIEVIIIIPYRYVTVKGTTVCC